MSPNKEDLKNKIIYRASYRGSKEMDILMTAFVKSIINEINSNSLNILDEFVNMNDETLVSIKNKDSLLNISNPIMLDIVDRFQKFKL